MEDFAFNILETLNANQQLDMLHDLGPKYGLDPENVVQMGLSLPDWAEAQQRPLHAHRGAEPRAPRPHHRAHGVASTARAASCSATASAPASTPTSRRA